MPALAAICIGCRGTSVVAPPPTPDIRQQSAAQLGFVLEEADEHGATRALPERGRAYVDVNSAVRIAPRIPPLTSGTEAANLARLRASLESASSLILHARDSLRILSEKVSAAATQFAMSRESGDTIAAFKQLAAVDSGKRNLQQRLILTARDLDRAGMRRILNTAGSETSRLLVELIALRSKAALDSIRNETRHLAASDRFHIEMSAVRFSPGRTPVQLHLPGYDNLAPGEPVVIDKLSLAASPEESAELEKTTATIQALIRNSRDLGDVLRNVSSGTIDAARTMVAALDTLGQAMRELPSSAEIKDLLRGLNHVPPGTLKPFGDAATAVLGPLDQLLALRDSILAAPERLRSSPSPTAPFELLDTWSRQAKTIVEDVANLKDSVTKAARALGKADVSARYDELLAKLTPEQRAQITAAQGAVMTSFAKAVQQIVSATQELNAQIPILRNRVDLFTSLVPAQAVTSPGSATVRDLISVRSSEVGITTLELLRIDRREGDHIIVSLKVVDSETREAMGVPAEYTIGVRSFGWYRRWSGGLSFAKPFHPEPAPAGSTAEVGFRPGVSASWIVHHRRRPEQPQWLSMFSERGVGIALTSVLFTRDDTIEMGFGPTLTLFNDIVQVGGGFNLQSEKWYFLLNTPLLELLQRSPSPSPSRPSEP